MREWGGAVIFKDFKRHARLILLATAATVAIVLPGAPASAESLFGFLFGAPPARSVPASATAYSDPYPQFGAPTERSAETSASGPAVAYCVRLCDGRFFPIQRSGGADPAQVCSSFCPAAKTKIFSGSGIDHAAARDGTRYADLQNAFTYRERLVPGCSCNGKDSVGLVTTPAAEDPTLRAGDIVATNTGFVTYNGGRRNAEFTPVTGEMRARLANTKIIPSNAKPTPVTVSAATASNESRGRRVQASR
jgi:hypothetical protein